MKIQTFSPRFVASADLDELSQLWHLSRTARPGDSRYARLLWASGEFAKAHPSISATGAYKDLDTMLSFGGR